VEDEPRSAVQGAHHVERAAVDDVGVDHGRPHVLVAEQRLDGPDVGARFQQRRREAVAEGVAHGAPVDLGGARRGDHGLLHRALMEVVEDDVARGGIGARSGCGEDVLPGDARRSPGELQAQRARKVDLAPAGGQLGAVARGTEIELGVEGVA
jgi:hypothetical protein